jgi:hypothetical protein
MNLLRQGVVWALIMLVLILYLPVSVFAQEKTVSAREKITAHPLEVRSTPKEEMEVEKVEKKSKWWLWGLLGAVLAGGAVAAGGSSSGGSDSNGDTGGITGSW